MSHGIVTGMARGGAVSPLVVASDEGMALAVESFGDARHVHEDLVHQVRPAPWRQAGAAREDFAGQSSVEVAEGDEDLEFRCAVCHEIALSPVITPCEHLFCAACFGQWLPARGTCPTCRGAVSLGDLRELTAAAFPERRAGYNGLAVCCPLCPWTGQMGEWEAHSSRDCSGRDISHDTRALGTDAVALCEWLSRSNALRAHTLLRCTSPMDNVGGAVAGALLGGVRHHFAVVEFENGFHMMIEFNADSGIVFRLSVGARDNLIVRNSDHVDRYVVDLTACKIEDYIRSVRGHSYNILLWNCQHFVEGLVECGGSHITKPVQESSIAAPSPYRSDLDTFLTDHGEALVRCAHVLTVRNEDRNAAAIAHATQTTSKYLGPAGALWRQASGENRNAIELCPILVLEVDGSEGETPLAFFLSLEYGRQGLLWHEYAQRPALDAAPTREVQEMSSPTPLLRIRDLLRSLRELRYDPRAGVHGSWFVDRLIADALVSS